MKWEKSEEEIDRYLVRERKSRGERKRRKGEEVRERGDGQQ